MLNTIKASAHTVRCVSEKNPMRSIPSARLRGLMARSGSAETRSDGGILVTDPHRCNDDGLLDAEFPLGRTRIYLLAFRPRGHAPAPFHIVDQHRQQFRINIPDCSEFLRLMGTLRLPGFVFARALCHCRSRSAKKGSAHSWRHAGIPQDWGLSHDLLQQCVQLCGLDRFLQHRRVGKCGNDTVGP